jgi:uncharacterized DUF497 family protein
MATVVEGDFEWDSAKAGSNITKHGVSFFEAATVFADPSAVYLDDGSGDWGLGRHRNVPAGTTSLRGSRAAGRKRSNHQRASGRAL